MSEMANFPEQSVVDDQKIYSQLVSPWNGA